LQTETAIDLNACDSLIDPLTLLFIVKPPTCCKNRRGRKREVFGLESETKSGLEKPEYVSFASIKMCLEACFRFGF